MTFGLFDKWIQMDGVCVYVFVYMDVYVNV